MKKDNILYQRDLLFPTNQSSGIGVIEVKLLSVNENNKITVVAEAKTDHNLLEYIEILVKAIDAEIFKRVDICITENVDLIFVHNEKGYRIIFEGKESAALFHIEDLKEGEISLLNLI